MDQEIRDMLIKVKMARQLLDEVYRTLTAREKRGVKTELPWKDLFKQLDKEIKKFRN
jgi:hypothetical protein